MATSTGPKTSAGKKTSSQNAVKHGLLAGKWLPPDEKAALEKLLFDLLGEYGPATATRQIMIERIALGMTKLRRLHVMEDAMHASARITNINRKRAGEPEFKWVDDDLLEAGALPPIEAWGLLARYQTALNRQISKAIGELLALKQVEAQRISATVPQLAVVAPPSQGIPATKEGASNLVRGGPLAGKWLAAEDRVSLDELVRELRLEYLPMTATHHIMIERIAMTITKNRRLHALEDALHETARVHAKRMQERGHARFNGMEPELAQAIAIPNVGVLAMLSQYQASLDREISKSIGELLQIKLVAIPGGVTTPAALSAATGG